MAEFEAFFTHLHTFEFDTRVGVSPVYFYDTASRPVAVVSPNNSYVKSLFSAWHAEEWDSHDTVELDPPPPDGSRRAALCRIPLRPATGLSDLAPGAAAKAADGPRPAGCREN